MFLIKIDLITYDTIIRCFGSPHIICKTLLLASLL